MSHLPLELWYLVAENTPQNQLKSFLGISRLHRSIALKLLFSSVKVFFGAPEIREIEMTSEDAEELYECSMRTTWEILNAISRDPSFAQAVKKLTIYAFMEAESFGAFHIGPISEALKALPHLVSFTWFGRSPSLPVQVLDSIITHCENLREISVPSVLWFMRLFMEN
jgi:hypothetical protein